MLQVADVTKLRCNFVSDVYEYFNSKKYELHCNNSTAIQSYLDFKLGESYLCPLNIEDVCRLQDIKEKVTALECESQSFICSLQASVRLSSSEKLIEYTTTLENKVNGSAFAFVEINNGTNQTAYINFVTRDQYGNIYDTHEVHSGSIKVGGIEYVNSAYDLGGSITIRLPNVRTLTDTYVTNVRLYHTDAGGIYTGQFADINVSPLSSPHLTGLYTVSAADLYFTSASWANAMNQVLYNAVLALSGSATYIYPECVANADNSVEIVTRINHSPLGIFWGLLESVGNVLTGSSVTYFNGGNGSTTTLYLPNSPNHKKSRAGWIHADYALPLPFGTVNLEIPNTLISFPLNNLSTYKLLFPASNFATPALSIVGTTVNEDHKVLLTAIIDTSQMFTSKWFSPLNVLLSTTNEVFLHNPASGNYTYELTLASGCVITDTITI